MKPINNSFMFFYEIANMFGISAKTLKKKISEHANPEINKLNGKKGSGSYFYNNEEIQLLIKEFKPGN